MCVILVMDQGIQENIMHEKELLIRCVQKPGYAAARLQSHYGYSMLELQRIRNGESIHKSTE